MRMGVLQMSRCLKKGYSLKVNCETGDAKVGLHTNTITTQGLLYVLHRLVEQAIAIGAFIGFTSDDFLSCIESEWQKHCKKDKVKLTLVKGGEN